MHDIRSCFLILLCLGVAATSAPEGTAQGRSRQTTAAPAQQSVPAADLWRWRNPSPQGAGLRSLCFAKGKFVAAGYSGAILSSVDGTVLIRRTVSDTEGLLVACSDAGFVAAGYNYGSHTHAAVYHSPDGETWAALPRGSVPDLATVMAADGRFVGLEYTGAGVCSSVAVGEFGAILTAERLALR